MIEKDWYRSKIVLFNVLMLVLGVAPVIAESTKVIAPGYAAVIDAVLALVTGVGNVVLRVWYTDTAIKR